MKRLVEVAAGCAGGAVVAAVGLAAYVRVAERRIEAVAGGSMPPYDWTDDEIPARLSEGGWIEA